MRDFVQVHAEIPRQLKRQAFIAFAEQEVRFAPWLRAQLEAWLLETEQADKGRARPEGDSKGDGEEHDRTSIPGCGVSIARQED